MTLSGLGFNRADENRPLPHLSGGQRTRVMLAKLLLTRPDLLLLDEPTNHLDIAAVEWLEDHLKDWPGAVLIVSHDRYFLDQVATSTWEMTPSLEEYRGNYSAYLISVKNAINAGWRNIKPSRSSLKKKKTTSAATSPVRTRARHRADASGWNAC